MIRLIFLCFLLSNLTFSLVGQTSVMTYNIRYDNPDDGENWWDKRKEEVVALIQYYQPDFLGIQEGINHQVTFLNNSLPNFDYIGVGRDGPGKVSEFVALFYNKEKYELLESTTFWLSPTLDKISKGWDAALNRISTYGKFKHLKSGKEIHVFNAHFDHLGKVAREQSAKVILEKIKALTRTDDPVVVMGDFNSSPSSKPIQMMESELQDSRKISKQKPYGPEGTFSGFDVAANLDNRIDYVFVKNLDVLSNRHIDDRRKNNLWVSDHLPIWVWLDF